MKNILVVTGGAGFVGSNLIELLLIKTNKRIISIDNYSSGTTKNHIRSKRIKYLNGNTKDINRILKDFKKTHQGYRWNKLARLFTPKISKNYFFP